MKITLFLSLLLYTSHTQFTDTGFLSTFGYLNTGNTDESESLVIVTPEAKAEAVKEFQKYYGLAATGDMNDETWSAMNTPRCGVPDKDGPEESIEAMELTKKKEKRRKRKRKQRRRSKRYIHSSTKWGNTKLSYRFLNYTSDIPQSLTRAAFREAFDLWEEHSALEFYEETRSQLGADIEIAYIHGRHNDKSVFNSLILGHAFFPEVGWLHMNDQQMWSYNSFRGMDTVFVAVHELGHILGLRHSKAGSIMHASYPGYSADIKLSRDDIDGVQDLYGPNPCKPNNPCQNRGVCSKSHSGTQKYSCSCSVGWKGSRCQWPIKSGSDNKKCRNINIRNGVTVPTGRTAPGEVVQVYCDTGFELVGAGKLTCSHTGSYSPPQSNTLCRRKIICPELRVENGRVYPRRGVEAESTVSFSCNDGYQLSGATKVKCRTDGTYDRTTPTCKTIAENDRDFCPDSFDSLSSRTVRDTMIYAFKGSRFWIFRNGGNGPKSHWSHSGEMSHEFPNIPVNVDAVFSYTDPDSYRRYLCFVKWPQVYYWDVMERDIYRIDNFPDSFPLPETQQITAALRWDEDTIYFFVPDGYFIYSIQKRAASPSFLQPISNMMGMPASTSVTAASRSFDDETISLFSDKVVYQVRKSDKQVMRNYPRTVSDVWNEGLDECQNNV